MPRTSKASSEKRSWSLPAPEDSLEAITYLHHREQKPVKLNLKFKLHKPGRWKAQKLLNAHIHCTNRKSQILQAWAEDPFIRRDDGAFATIQHVIDESKRKIAQKQQANAQALEAASETADANKNTAKVRYQARNFGSVISAQFPQTQDDPFIARFYEAIGRECAQTIMSWRQKIIKIVASELGKKQGDLSLDDIYTGWRKQEEAYRQAAAMPIPFGRNKGYPLERHGKREARWLFRQMLPEDEITTLLETVEILLDDDARVINGYLGLREHSWKRDRHHRHAVRESQLLQRVLDPPNDLVLLGELHKDELITLRNELREMGGYAAAIQHKLEHFQAALAETREAATILENVRGVLETFLYKKPPACPSIDPVQFSTSHQAMLEETYWNWLTWFQVNPERAKDAERFLSQEQEQRHVDGMLRAAKALKPPKLQPLPFISAMRPGLWRDFALLYDRDTYEYILAIALYKRDASDENDQVYRQQQTHPQRQEEQRVYQQRRTEHPLYYVNFPETPFTPPEDVAIMLFPLEYGFDHHDKQFLRNIIERQRKAQNDKFAIAQSEGKATSLSQCLPTAVITTARIICTWDKHKRPVFYAHISLEPSLPEVQPVPDRVIGLSEDDDGYYFVVSELDGRVAHDETKVIAEDLHIREHVDPVHGAKPNSENYIFEVANKIIALAQQYNAVIGIEDTSWKKQRPDLSRERNHQVFRRPSRRIMTTVGYKAQLAGISCVYFIDDVSPVRDCSHCCSGLTRGTKAKTTYYEWRMACPTCKTHQAFDKTMDMQQCTSCGAKWKPQEDDVHWKLMFACPQCNASACLAQYNRAMVVAQKTLMEIHKHYVNALAYDKRKEEKRVASQKSLSETSNI